jgi:hypothetical protein
MGLFPLVGLIYFLEICKVIIIKIQIINSENMKVKTNLFYELSRIIHCNSPPFTKTE